uniref:mitochondrial import receptor subunit TOM20-like n=1 Tax=Erigeron canadensis TaxID=72917 RepID=UPI001CB89B79|nr:mitochondrial import receptor subunit TOM20-like [Erigeron canadensis]
MEPSQEDIERLIMFEHARIIAETHYAKDPTDADNLTRWGGALLELSHLGDANEGRNMIKVAISKLEEALSINPVKHEALWCLGNALTSLAFITPDTDEAQILFEEASDSFQKAVNQCPGNELYLQSLANSSKAPELHYEFHKHGGFNQTHQPSGGESTTSARAKGPAKTKSSDLKYDVLGWVILAAGVVIWVGMAKSQMPR